MLNGRRILLIISGGIAAYKSLDLIRRLRERGVAVRAVMTAAAAHFVTPLSVAALCEDKVYTDLWSLTTKARSGISAIARGRARRRGAGERRSARANGVGLADDLATTVLRASDKPVLIAPTMNLMMWGHSATQANLATLAGRGVTRIGPGSGELACGRSRLGTDGRAAGEFVAAIEKMLVGADRRLAGWRHGCRAARPASRSTRSVISRTIRQGSRGMRSRPRLPASAPTRYSFSGPTQEPTPVGVELVPVETASRDARGVRGGAFRSMSR